MHCLPNIFMICQVQSMKGHVEMKPVIGLGAGGHAKVVIDLIRLQGEYDVIGLLDPKRELWQRTVSGIPVLGSDELLSELRQQGVHHAFIGLGTTGDLHPRRRLYELACEHGFEVISAKHPKAIIASSVMIGRGATIMAGAIINADAQIGEDVIVNTGAIIEHDCRIGSHVHIATGACLASTVTVGDNSHIGLGASIRQCIRIGRNVIVGAGAVVVDDVPDGVVVVGVPARIIREVKAA